MAGTKPRIPGSPFPALANMPLSLINHIISKRLFKLPSINISLLILLSKFYYIRPLLLFLKYFFQIHQATLLNCLKLFPYCNKVMGNKV